MQHYTILKKLLFFFNLLNKTMINRQKKKQDKDAKTKSFFSHLVQLLPCVVYGYSINFQLDVIDFDSFICYNSFFNKVALE